MGRKGRKSEGKEGKEARRKARRPMKEVEMQVQKKSPSSSPWGSPARRSVLWPGWVSQAGSASLAKPGFQQKPAPGPRPTVEVCRGGVGFGHGRWPLPPLLSILGPSSFLSLALTLHGPSTQSSHPLLTALQCPPAPLLPGALGSLWPSWGCFSPPHKGWLPLRHPNASIP